MLHLPIAPRTAKENKMIKCKFRQTPGSNDYGKIAYDEENALRFSLVL